MIIIPRISSLKILQPKSQLKPQRKNVLHDLIYYLYYSDSGVYVLNIGPYKLETITLASSVSILLGSIK